MMYLHKVFGMDKGYIVIAQNNDTTDYLEQAYALALNLKLTQSTVSNLTVCVDAKTKKLIKDTPIALIVNANALTLKLPLIIPHLRFLSSFLFVEFVYL